MNKFRNIIKFSHFFGNLRFNVILPADTTFVGSECRSLTSLPSNNNGLRRAIQIVNRAINSLAALYGDKCQTAPTPC